MGLIVQTSFDFGKKPMPIKFSVTDDLPELISPTVIKRGKSCQFKFNIFYISYNDANLPLF